MIFSSMIFLWVFLPSVIVINYILGSIKTSDRSKALKRKNIFLLCASLVFYAWGGIDYLYLMLGVIIISYLGGIVIDAKKSRVLLTFIVLILLSGLIVFKYSAMLAGMLHAKDWPEFVLPIGISFYTFQALSYVIDVYRGKVRAMTDLPDLALYISFFPQLIAGPIVRYADINGQINARSESAELFLSGQKRFCFGLAKKVLIANTLAEVADKIWDMKPDGLDTAVAWLGAIAYTLQIYYDFSGYSDMAIGLGRMFGFEFKENFNYPYTSSSVTEFWRRWHMSLSGWFREYVYIPLGGNRHGTVRTCLNLMVVFMITGIWHGAGYTFLLWGFMYGVILVVERLFFGKVLKLKAMKIPAYLYTGLVVIVGWVIFRAPDIEAALAYLSRMFTINGDMVKIPGLLSMKSILALIFGIICMGPVSRLYKDRYGDRELRLPYRVLSHALGLSLLIISIVSLAAGTYNPFIYFRF